MLEGTNRGVMNKYQDKNLALQEAIGLLYEAAIAPEEWRLALDRIYQLFDAMAAHFFLWDRRANCPVGSYGSTTYLG